MTEELPEWATLRENGDVAVETAAQALRVLDYLEPDDNRNIVITDRKQSQLMRAMTRIWHDG